MSYKIVIASTNAGKVIEIKRIFESMGELNWEIQSLQDYNIPEPDEPYNTFMENAVHKAKYYAQHTNQITLADDSGLSVEALNGFPGVRTKEFTIEYGGMKNALVKLEQLLKESKDYNAYFTNASAVYIPSQDVLITNEAQDYGTLSFPSRGDEGFGFDPVFIPNGYNQTFAQLGIDVKNKISHRGRAVAGIIEKLKIYFTSAA